MSVKSYNSVKSDLPDPFCNINTMENLSGYIFFESNQQQKIHIHPFYHANYLFSGELDIHFCKNVYNVSVGQMFFLPPGIPHSLYSKSGYSQIGADLIDNKTCSPLYSAVREVIADNCIITDPFEVNASYKSMTDLILNPSNFNLLKIRNISESVILQGLNMIKQKNSRFSDSFNQILKSHPNFDLTLNQIALEMNYSTTHLERLSMRHFGCSVAEYLNRAKLIKICSLLRTTDLTLSEIAEQTHFYDAGHLSVFFKNRMNQTPGKYRNHSIL